MFIGNYSLKVETKGRGTYEITDKIQAMAGRAAASSGMMSVFIHHTSASLIVCENADPTVREDLERFMARVAPDGDPLWEHASEGPDDMPAHIRSILTQPSISIPMSGGRALLGTWQGVYVWEHRTGPHTRHLTVSVLGDQPG